MANAAGGNATIVLADGTYTLADTLYVRAPNIGIVSASGRRESVTIQGDAMSATASVGNLIRVDGANFRLDGITLQRSRWHLIQIAGESNPDGARITNCAMRDSYEQMLKVTQNLASSPHTADNGLVENCVFEYTAGVAPQYYVGGIDAHGARDWVVRGNRFANIASPESRVAEHAIHFWSGSANVLIERNVIVDCDRGIGLGLGTRGNTGGTVRNNMVHHTTVSRAAADVGIQLESSPGTRVHNNTVLLESPYQNAIEYRFTATTGVSIENNLTNKPIAARDGATGTTGANVSTATRATFRLTVPGDLHLSGSPAGIVDSGRAIAGLVDDVDGQPRPMGAGIDIGADEVAP